MLQKYLKAELNLKMFDEGTATGAETQAESGHPSNALEEKGEEKVIYGKQPEENPVAEEPKTLTPEERRKAYDEYINGDGKEFYTEDTQRMINRRFREMKTLQEENNRIKSAISPLMSKYGTDDVEKLAELIQSDDDTWKKRADELGMTVEQVRERDMLIRENESAKQFREQKEREEYATNQYKQWISEASEVRQIYPEFDVRAELSNPEFTRLLVNGINMQQAYEVMHMNEIKNRTASEVSKATSEHIKARGMRPSENGIAGSAGVVIKSDPSKYTDEDITEIIKRVKSGEKIIL